MDGRAATCNAGSGFFIEYDSSRRWTVNPLFGAMFGVLHLLNRKCPKCHREQTVTADKMNKALPCKYCGFIIQPPNKDLGYRTHKRLTALFHNGKKQRT
jgi:DNA-directed RNA polymerase subunit RPC12/RpoP